MRQKVESLRPKSISIGCCTRSIRNAPYCLFISTFGRKTCTVADDLAKGVRRLSFKFSKHALEELERRQIPRTTIERVL
jgi:hypothetical protein